MSAPALGPATATRDLPAGLSVEALKNATYQSGFNPAGVVRLREGAYRAPLVPGSATMLTVQLGAGNIVAGLTQGLPVSGSGSRTAVAEAAGARSQLSALVAAGVVVVVE